MNIGQIKAISYSYLKESPLTTFRYLSQFSSTSMMDQLPNKIQWELDSFTHKLLDENIHRMPLEDVVTTLNILQLNITDIPSYDSSDTYFQSLSFLINSK